jgi:uncharacterized protein (DUF1684 family)
MLVSIDVTSVSLLTQDAWDEWCRRHERKTTQPSCWMGLQRRRVIARGRRVKLYQKANTMYVEVRTVWRPASERADYW